MKIYENPWNPWTCMGYICFGRRTWLYCRFWTNKRLTYLSSKEKSIVQTKEMRIEVFGKTWTLTCKLHIKITFFMKTWNDPTVTTHILPQTVPRKTIIKVKFLTNMLKSIFFKVWDSFSGQYSIIWRNSCGKFNGKLFRTTLEWSREPRNPKNHEFILDYLGSGGRRQRRQPLNKVLS